MLGLLGFSSNYIISAFIAKPHVHFFVITNAFLLIAEFTFTVIVHHKTSKNSGYSHLFIEGAFA